LIIPVEAVGKLAVRMFEGFDQDAAGAIALCNRLLAFRGLIELGVCQDAGQLDQAVLAGEGLQGTVLHCGAKAEQRRIFEHPQGQHHVGVENDRQAIGEGGFEGIGGHGRLWRQR
jgi:hypothetical protein